MSQELLGIGVINIENDYWLVCGKEIAHFSILSYRRIEYIIDATALRTINDVKIYPNSHFVLYIDSSLSLCYSIMNEACSM